MACSTVESLSSNCIKKYPLVESIERRTQREGVSEKDAAILATGYKTAA